MPNTGKQKSVASSLFGTRKSKCWPVRSASRLVDQVQQLALMLLLLLYVPARVEAVSVLRIGPFDFTAAARLEATYTTNVDGTRPSQTDLEQRDLYFIYGLDFRGVAPLGPKARLDLTWSLEWERHVNRSDLDTQADDPLGSARIEIPWEVSPALRLTPFAAYDHSLETRESAFAGGARTRRDENTITSYGIRLNYGFNRLRISSDYISERERHVLDEFKDGDEDRESFSFVTSYAFFPRIRGVYEFDRERGDLLQTDADFTGSEDTYGIGLDVDIWLRPRVVYSFRYEREDLLGETGAWDPTHTVTVGDAVPIVDRPDFTLSFFASYKQEQNPEDDDVAFQYGLSLFHAINPVMSQTLGMRREPVDTLGSSTDTTVTDWTYTFTRRHFLLPAVTLQVGAGYSINEPTDPRVPDEEILDLNVGVNHSRQVTPHLSRTLAYLYALEDSSLETELLEEHRLTLAFIYAF